VKAKKGPAFSGAFLWSCAIRTRRIELIFAICFPWATLAENADPTIVIASQRVGAKRRPMTG
jgi:hypothetical protein